MTTARPARQAVLTSNDTATTVINSARRTAAIESAALCALADAFEQDALSTPFEAVARLIVASRGRVVVTGIGKSGIIARKIAATLASTGTPALFLHPSEASHGDLGMVTPDDIVIALSWSGETEELGDIVSYCQRFAVALVAVTANADSTLSKQADWTMTLPLVKEACPNRLAPTSSTIVQAGLGDALAVALIELRGFSPDDFRLYHPRGKLGAQLLRICDLMSTGDHIPAVGLTATLLDAMLEMSRKRFGVTAIVDDKFHLSGAFTDGDVRRVMTSGDLHVCVVDYMSLSPVWVPADMLASQALALMSEHKISQLFACEAGRLIGIVHLHDLLRAGVV